MHVARSAFARAPFPIANPSEVDPVPAVSDFALLPIAIPDVEVVKEA